MNELEQIVQRMLDAGESEENIKLVIQQYKQGNQTDSSTQAQATESSATGLNLESGFSESLQFSFGDDRAYTREQILLENVETQEDGSVKTSINKDFFNQEDEDIVAQLKAQYGNAYNFEEVFFTNETAGGYGSFAAVKVSTKDGKNSKIIEANIDGRGRTDDTRTQKALEKYKQDPDSLNSFEMTLVNKFNNKEAAYQKSFDDLTSFMKEFSTDETNQAISQREQEIMKAYDQFNNYVKVDVEAIEKKYSDPNLFNTVEEKVKQARPTDMGMGYVYDEYTKTTQPYKEELELAMKQLGVNQINKDVKDLARTILIENERRASKEAKTTEVLEELEDGNILPISLQRYKDAPEELKNILTVGSKMFQKEYATKLEIFESEKKDLETNEDILKFTNLSKKLNNSEYQFEILEGEPTVFLEDGREVPERLINQYEKDRVSLKPRYDNFFKLQNDLIDNRYNIEDNKSQLDLLRRDYNDLEAFAVKTGLGFQELAINVGGATEDMEAHANWMKAKKEIQAKREEYAKPIAFDDAFKSWTNFGKFAHSELSNQISIFTALSVPYAGWGTLLASSFGEQYGEMTAEEIASDGKVDYSVYEKILTSGGYAVPEFAFEYLTTIPLLRGAGNALKGAYGTKIRDLTYEGLKQGVKSQTPTFVKGSVYGSLGEGATTLTQNIVTGKPYHENVDHSLFSGLMFETTLAGTPVIAGAVTNVLTDYTASEDFRNNLKSTNKIIQDNKNLDTKIRILKKSKTPGAKQKIADAINQKINNKEKIKELANANETILKNQKETITGRWLGWGKNNREGMSAGAFKAYLEVTNQQEQLRIKAEEIINSKGISQQEKNRRLKDLRDNGFTDSNGKKYNGFDILQGARDAFRNEKNSEFNLWRADKNNKEKLNKYLDKAQDYIDNANKETTPSWAKDFERDDIARILFNIDKINENLKGASKRTTLEKDLNVYQTTEQAVAEMTKLGIDASVIKSVKDGSHGFDGPNNQSYIIVENMAKDDRLETKTHELSHRFFTNAISANPEAFREISETIFEWSKQNDTKLFNRLVRQELTVDSAPDEIVAVFLEEAAAERIDLNKKGIAGIIGHMTGNIMKEGYGVDMDFAGQSDVIKMLIGLGKKIKAGKLTLKDREAIIKSEAFKKAKGFAAILEVLDPMSKDVVKKSKPLDAIKALVPKTVKTQKDYYALLNDPRIAKKASIERIFDGRNLAPVIEAYIRSRSTSLDIANENIKEVKKRLANFDPAATREDGSIVGPESFGEFIFANARFGKMVAEKKLAIKAAERKRTTRIDDPDVKDIPDDKPTPTSQTLEQKQPKIRKLKEFDVELSNPEFISALTMTTVNDLLNDLSAGKITFDQAVARIETLVLKDIRSELNNSIPKIAKNPKTGKIEPTPEYEKFIRGEFDEVVSSLGIDVIRKFYNAWFEQTKVGRQDYKNIDPVTGKVSNFRKDIFINKANKIKYIKFFLEGKPNVLRERRTALIRRISKRKVSLAIDNYIEENSNNLGDKMKAKMRTMSDSAQNAINEQVSFDHVKFSAKLNSNDLRINKSMERLGYYKAPNGKIMTFAKRKDGKWDKGRVFEQALTETLQEISKNIKNVFIQSEVATEEGGRADIVIEYYDGTNRIIENHEIKKGLSAFMGSTLISELNLETEDFALANEIHNDIKGLDKLIKDVVKNLKEKVNIINNEINIYNEKYGYKKGDIEFADQITGNVVKRKPESMPLEVYDKVGKELGVLKAGVEVIANHYKGKTIKVDDKKIDAPVKSISLFGYGAFRIDPSSIFKGLPMLDVATEVYASIRYGKRETRGSKDFVTFKPGLQFRLDGKPKNESNSGITTEQSIMQALNSPAFSKEIGNHKVLRKAVNKSREIKQSRGITVLDFDDTLATTESLVKFTAPDGTTGTLNAEQFASTYQDLQDQGYTFDFSDFNKVVKGKLAPLFNKAIKLQGKFGPENMFVLTARPPAAQKPIFDFLKANGLNIPLKNITGLGNSTAEAKALWIADKVADGYNDFYFADDALQNVQAVKNMLDQFDVKSKVQQAKVKFSESLNDNFNKILEQVTGIEAKKRFSDTKARKRGEDKGKFRFFIPPSHEDFIGLLYNFMGKGRQGDAHRDFFEQALVRPLNRAYREIDTAKQAIANDYKSLNKQFPDVKKKLIKTTPDGDFTFQDAIRVYLWNKHGYTIPGLSKTDQANLVEIVMNDVDLLSYAEGINTISRQDTYVDPGQNWETGNIRIDLVDATGRVGRAEYFAEFNENADIIFSPENLNKIEAAYGKGVREALEDMLHRIKTGVNRPKGASAKPNMLLNWLNASVSGVMFFNTRSALLQQMSNVNYLNFADNNIYAAGKAFANQKQYWEDFAMIFNSDMLKQRRGGLQTDINGAELAEAIKKARPGNMFDQVAIITGKALRLGFLPTQIGDNIAIATGGAAFYRNRVNKYIKDGLSKKEAEDKAFTDLQDITNATQQSARPDMTSQQQAAVIGKIVLNFLNTPSQYNRIIKKAGSDIINRRITPPNTTQLQSDMSNMSRILYYGAAQNLIFYSLQTALFAVMFGLDDEDEQEKAEQFLKKKERVIQGSIDTILRGSGIYGVAISTIKNMVRKFLEQREKGYNKDESAVIMEMLNFSPVVGIKARKIVNAEKTLNYNKDIIKEMETFDIDNPMWSAVTNYVEVAGPPVNRIYQKTINLRNAMDNQYSAFERAMFFSGYTTWSLGLGDTQKMKDVKQKVKDKKKEERRKKKEQDKSKGLKRKKLKRKKLTR